MAGIYAGTNAEILRFAQNDTTEEDCVGQEQKQIPCGNGKRILEVE
jgi:hypothetical protein